MKRLLALAFLCLAFVLPSYGSTEGTVGNMATVPSVSAPPTASSPADAVGSASMTKYADGITKLKAFLENSDVPLYKILNGWHISAVFHAHKIRKVKQIYDQFTVEEKRKFRACYLMIQNLAKSRYGFNARRATTSQH